MPVIGSSMNRGECQKFLRVKYCLMVCIFGSSDLWVGLTSVLQHNRVFPK